MRFMRSFGGSRREFVGNVDTWAPVLNGWLLDQNSMDVPIEIAVVVDEEEVARVRCTESREDVVRQGFPTPICGFTVPLAEFISDQESHVVRLVDVRSQIEVFVSPEPVRLNRVQPRAVEEQTGIASIRGEIGSLDAVRSTLATTHRLAILSSYRTSGGSESPVRSLVDSLRTVGCSVVVVDTSPFAPSDALGADLVLWRTNVGWDFASWFAALERLADLLPLVDHLHLVNDSCIGPFGGLDDVMRRGEALGVDMWSLTDSWEKGYHLQSYFLSIDRKVLESGFLGRFASDYPYPVLKKDIVELGEIALARAARDDGFAIASVFPYERLVSDFEASLDNRIAAVMDRPEVRAITSVTPSYRPPRFKSLVRTFESIQRGLALNPTHWFWDVLLDAGFPFVKRDLILQDPAGVMAHAEIAAEISKRASVTELERVRQDLMSRPGSRFLELRDR